MEQMHIYDICFEKDLQGKNSLMFSPKKCASLFFSLYADYSLWTLRRTFCNNNGIFLSLRDCKLFFFCPIFIDLLYFLVD